MLCACVYTGVYKYLYPSVFVWILNPPSYPAPTTVVFEYSSNNTSFSSSLPDRVSFCSPHGLELLSLSASVSQGLELQVEATMPAPALLWCRKPTQGLPYGMQALYHSDTPSPLSPIVPKSCLLTA